MFKKHTISKFQTGGGGNKSSIIELLLNKPKAFTMAEVLITLGIIGIVAAMTLPTVINNAQDRQFRAMFKKQVSIISQAMQMIYAQDEAFYNKPFKFDENLGYETVDHKEFSRYVCQIGIQLKTQYSGLNCNKILTTSDLSDLDFAASELVNENFQWHKENEWIDKTGKPMSINGAFMRYTFYLPDGAMINFNSMEQIFIDVNGKKNPNTVGRDIFYLIIPENSPVPSFFEKNGKITVNDYDCPNHCKEITEENYIDDCKHGSGWGCSPLYILQ